MSSISSIGSTLPSLPPRLAPVPPRTDAAATDTLSAPPPAGGFAQVFDQLLQTVDSKQAEASDTTRKVLLGESGQLHQSVIAMQEASTALTLMVEVRNKLVDSYQELMRMPV